MSDSGEEDKQTKQQIVMRETSETKNVILLSEKNIQNPWKIYVVKEKAVYNENIYKVYASKQNENYAHRQFYYEFNLMCDLVEWLRTLLFRFKQDIEINAKVYFMESYRLASIGQRFDVINQLIDTIEKTDDYDKIMDSIVTEDNLKSLFIFCEKVSSRV